MENAKNTIFEPLDFQNFLGADALRPTPPPLQTRASGARFQTTPVENMLGRPWTR